MGRLDQEYNILFEPEIDSIILKLSPFLLSGNRMEFDALDHTICHAKKSLMEISKELKEKYLEATRLLEDESSRDPKEEPYRSKYRAKSILSEIRTILESKTLASSNDSSSLHTARLTTILLHLGVVSTETEEISLGEKYLMKAFEGIADHLDYKFVICSMNIRNQLGIIWSQRSESVKACKWLEGAEKLYEEFVKEGAEQTPLSMSELFDVSDKPEKTGVKEMEKVHTLTKFYLAQVYGSLKDLLKSAIYCHETLRRQLIFNEYDPIDWVLNSATLSQFFMERMLFRQARHHLAAASHMLDEYEKSLKSSVGTDEELEFKNEELRHRRADVSRCWAKYGILLLEYSKNMLNNPSFGGKPEIENANLKNLWFPNADLYSRYENEIVASIVTTFDDARLIFLITQNHINRAKEYYSLECFASDHVLIVQDHSQLLKQLTAFEQEEGKQCKMIKKRIVLLDTVLKELNPQYYLNTCRQLWFELGESHYDLMQIKLQKMRDSKTTPSPHVLRKINLLAERSIENFRRFLDSVKDKSTRNFPKKLEEDLMKPILIAHFYLGRLHYKIITQDRTRLMENTKESFRCFKYLVDYCNENDSVKISLSEEVNVSTEMMSLLELKMLQI